MEVDKERENINKIARERIRELAKTINVEECPMLADRIKAEDEKVESEEFHEDCYGPYDDDSLGAWAQDLVTAEKQGTKLPREVEDFVIWAMENDPIDTIGSSENFIGACYYEGQIFHQDYEKAEKYYLRAAEIGNEDAIENLGYVYYYGRTGEPDYEKAYRYFSLGAFAGRLISKYKIGDMFLNGYYVEKDEKEALRIYKNCIRLIESDMYVDEDEYFFPSTVYGSVCLRLANMYFDGIGVSKDIWLAMEYYTKSAKNLFKSVSNGEFMYQKSLEDAINGQQKCLKEFKKEDQR